MNDTFFGIQLALDLPSAHPLRDELAQVVTRLHASTALPAQRSGWAQAGLAIRSGLAFARRGTWDLIRVHAQSEYLDWTRGLEAMDGWTNEDFGQSGTYVLASVVMLVQGGSNSDLTLGDICDIHESDWHRGTTYERLLGALPRLNYSNVHESALYLAPHPGYSGFDRDVLMGDGFAYLRDIHV
jgi:hypothetical protein